MTGTFGQLYKQWDTPCPTLTAVREHYFPHIKTDRRFRELINAGKIGLNPKKLHHSVRAHYVIYLHDLADYLDAQAKKMT